MPFQAQSSKQHCFEKICFHQDPACVHPGWNCPKTQGAPAILDREQLNTSPLHLPNKRSWYSPLPTATVNLLQSPPGEPRWLTVLNTPTPVTTVKSLMQLACSVLQEASPASDYSPEYVEPFTYLENTRTLRRHSSHLILPPTYTHSWTKTSFIVFLGHTSLSTTSECCFLATDFPLGRG